MAKLTSKGRKALKPSQFALPKERKYPVDDKSHAINAKARATQAVIKGLLSPTAKAIIDAKANAVIRRTSKPKKK